MSDLLNYDDNEKLKDLLRKFELEPDESVWSNIKASFDEQSPMPPNSFATSLQDFEATPDDKVWDNIQAGLESTPEPPHSIEAALQNFELEPDPFVWDNINVALSPKQPQRMTTSSTANNQVAKRWGLIALLLLLGVSGAYWLQYSNDTQQNNILVETKNDSKQIGVETQRANSSLEPNDLQNQVINEPKQSTIETSSAMFAEERLDKKNTQLNPQNSTNQSSRLKQNSPIQKNRTAKGEIEIINYNKPIRKNGIEQYNEVNQTNTELKETVQGAVTLPISTDVSASKKKEVFDHIQRGQLEHSNRLPKYFLGNLAIKNTSLVNELNIAPKIPPINSFDNLSISKFIATYTTLGLHNWHIAEQGGENNFNKNGHLQVEPSFSAGILLNFPIKKQFALQTGINYRYFQSAFETTASIWEAGSNEQGTPNMFEIALLSHNHQYNLSAIGLKSRYIPNDGQMSISGRQKLKYLSIPILGYYHKRIAPKWAIGFTAGTEINVLMQNKMQLLDYDLLGIYIEKLELINSEGLRDLSLSYLGGIDLNYQLSKHWGLYTQAMYTNSLSNMSNVSGHKVHFHELGIRLGTKYFF